MDCSKPVYVSCVITVGSIIKTMTKIYSGSEKDKCRGCSKFGKKSELFNLGSMEMNIIMNIKFISETVEVVVNKVPYNVSLLLDERFKDFTFCVGKDEIKVHKNIIAAASPVFSAMLEPHCLEFKEGKVNIVDFDFETMKAAVDLIYTQEVNTNLPIKILLNLYKFADKYDLTKKEEVLEQLKEIVSLDNIEEISKFSKVNAMDELYKKCVDYFAVDFEVNCRQVKKLDCFDPTFALDVMKTYQSINFY
uniref:BTB domain-containing protein n=1 Tax=Panagrolaimus sp. JU765 TaxID=591449 RepID=A0AC34R1K0_9BILA